METLERKIALWAVGDDTGLSSRFLAACALGQPDSVGLYWPVDPADFGRCYRLAAQFSIEELVSAFQVAAGQSPHWVSIVTNWDELCALWNEEVQQKSAPRLYKFMKSLGL